MSIDWLALFKKSQDSLKGYINPTELFKAITLALGASGGLWGFLQVIGDHLNDFVVDPVALLNLQHIISDATAKNWVAVILGVVTFLISVYNRFNKGAVVLNPGRIAESKSVVVEPVVKKTESEKVADGIVAPPV